MKATKNWLWKPPACVEAMIKRGNKKCDPVKRAERARLEASRKTSEKP